MKSILVPTGGSHADIPVFETALAAARLFSAHLQFVHMRVSPGQAAAYTPGVEYVSGPALSDALERLQTDADARLSAAAQRVAEFCSHANIKLTDAPGAAPEVTASWREETGDARKRMMFHSRHADLVVTGRAMRASGLPPDLLETLLLGCGRPMLLAPAQSTARLTGTVMVAWRETPDAARAAMAAMPLLTRAARVIFVAVDEGGDDTKDAVQDAARQFGWNGVPTEVELLAPAGRPIAEVLFGAAKTRGADLMVMGAYGHSPMRELIFGGCTQAAIRHSEIAILMLH